MKHEPWNPNGCPACPSIYCEVARRRELRAQERARLKKVKEGAGHVDVHVKN